jgi:hypothetical protein
MVLGKSGDGPLGHNGGLEALGGLIGFAIPPGEKWTVVPVAHVSLAPGRGCRIQVALSISC